MSYGNYRNYILDAQNRRAAQIAQNKWQQAAQDQQRAINQVKGDYLRGGANVRPDHKSWENLHIAQRAQPHGEQMEHAHNERMQAMQNYMDNEMAQVQDRFADMNENVIGGKRASDEMKYNLEMTKAQNDMRARMAENNARVQMNNKTTDSLSKSMEGFNQSLSGGQPDMPSVELYDNDGEYIGGSQYAGKNLFDKTGIKKSLMS